MKSLKGIKLILSLALPALLLVSFSPLSSAEMSYTEYQASLTRLLMLIEQAERNFQEVEKQLQDSSASLESQKNTIDEQTRLINSLQTEIEYWKDQTNHFETQLTSVSERLQKAEEVLKKQEESLLSYKKTVEREIRWLKVKGWIKFVVGIVIGYTLKK